MLTISKSYQSILQTLIHWYSEFFARDLHDSLNEAPYEEASSIKLTMTYLIYADLAPNVFSFQI